MIEDAREWSPLLVAVGVLAACAVLLAECTESFAHNGRERVEDVADGVRALQPAASHERAVRLARLFVESGATHGHAPRLLVALAMRESSLSPLVESRQVRGALGEIGLLQSHGVALRYRPDGCSSDLESAWCQVETGARFLAVVRRTCGGSWWRWVASYGASRCLTEAEARRDVATRRARRYYVAIGGEGWEP